MRPPIAQHAPPIRKPAAAAMRAYQAKPLTTSSKPLAPGALDLSGLMLTCAITRATGLIATAARSWSCCSLFIGPPMRLLRDRGDAAGSLLRRVDVETVRDGGGEFEVGMARRRCELLDRGLGAGLEHGVPRDAHDCRDPLGEQLLDSVEVQLALGPHLIDDRHGVGDEVGVSVLAQ